MIGFAQPGFLLLLSNLILPGAPSPTATDAKNLRTQIFVTNGYDKRVRPETNFSEPTNVWTEFSLLSIHDLDEATGTLTTTGYLHITWYDDFLVWNASDYGGLSYIFVPQDDVWKPDVALKNSVVQYKQLGVESLNVYAVTDGLTEWYPFQMFKSSCSVDITNFPFDKQKCELIFVAWSYTKAEVNMIEGTAGISLYEYQAHPEWDLYNSSSHVEQETAEASVIFTLYMRRKPQHTILTIIFPIVMLSVLNVIAFALPCESGEKAGYSVTVFLAFAVFLTIVSDSLPKSSDNISLFSMYLIVQTVQSTLITFIVMIQVRLSFLGPDTPVPRFLVGLVACIKCKPCSGKKKVAPHIQNNNKEGGNMGIIDEEFVKVRPDAETEAAVERHKDEENCDWKKVVNALDAIFFCFFALVTIVSSAACFGAAAASSVAT